MNPLIQQRYKIFSPVYQRFLVSEELRILILDLGLDLGLAGDGISALDNALTLYLLAILNAQELNDFIIEECDVVPETATFLVDKFTEALPRECVNQLEELYTATKAAIAQAPRQEDIAELAHAVSVRTMARDMHDLQSQDDNTPVHQSTQPAVRAPAPLPVPPTPSTAPKPASSTGTGPRWDSQEN